MADSVWGKGEKLTLDTIEKENPSGNWLNLAAGDGRYTDNLLESVNHLVLSDIDSNELDKITNLLSEEQRAKTSKKVFDMTKKFPFDKEYFDGVFCTGTLHLFDKTALNTIFSEITRVTKPNGKLIIDFATDVKRYDSNGKLKLLIDRPDYTLVYKTREVKSILKNLLKGYKLIFLKSTFEDDLTTFKEYGFKTRGNFLLIIGKKK